jgi:hypothetical protein
MGGCLALNGVRDEGNLDGTAVNRFLIVPEKLSASFAAGFAGRFAAGSFCCFGVCGPAAAGFGTLCEVLRLRSS